MHTTKIQIDGRCFKAAHALHTYVISKKSPAWWLLHEDGYCYTAGKCQVCRVKHSGVDRTYDLRIQGQPPAKYDFVELELNLDGIPETASAPDIPTAIRFYLRGQQVSTIDATATPDPDRRGIAGLVTGWLSPDTEVNDAKLYVLNYSDLSLIMKLQKLWGNILHFSTVKEAGLFIFWLNVDALVATTEMRKGRENVGCPYKYWEDINT